MAHVRSAAYAALVLVLLLAASAAAALPRPAPMPTGAVSWPSSSGLLIAEVVTGGASASDEFVELANAGSAPVDLAGLEVAYASSAGTTATRKVAWTTSLLVAPGRHVLLANALGAFAPVADATYSGGLAATGGAIVLRATGGAAIDAVGWGDAANAFVEGTAVGAPAVGSSVERRPGGSGGNTIDTNNNVADFVLNGAPLAQNLAAAPVPSPSVAPSATPDATPVASDAPTPDPQPSVTPTASASETPLPTAAPTVEPTPEPTAEPTLAPTLEPTAEPTIAPTPEPTLAPTPEPTLAPTPQPTPVAPPDPTPGPTPDPTASPIPSASPDAVIPLADARALADGATATVEGVLTTALGALEANRSGFLQDASGGIAVYLDAAFDLPYAAGTRVRATGVLASRYAERTLRANRADVVAVAGEVVPGALAVGTGAATEGLEGLRLSVTGVITEAPAVLADGLGLMLDDGTGPLRVIAGPDALGGLVPATGMTLTAIGPLGQRDSSGTGLEGYRLFALGLGDITVVAPVPSTSPQPSASPQPSVSPTASPTASPSVSPVPSASLQPSPSPSPQPQPTPSASPSPSPTPSATPFPTATPLGISAARSVAVGTAARVKGTVIAEAGRLGAADLFAIADATGGLPVRLARGMSAPPRGTLVEVRGTVAAPYGQTELRLQRDSLVVLGTADPPVPLAVQGKDLGEVLEGRLVTVAGTITVGATRSGDQLLTMRGADGSMVRLAVDASAAISAAALRKGFTGTFTGLVGQRASHKGASDGYRVWLRGPADIGAATPATSPSPSATPAPGTTSGAGTSSGLAADTIAAARIRDGSVVTIEGVVTADRSLLDASGRRTVLEDATGAIELYLAAPDLAVRSGARLRVTGSVGRAWGAPRLHVTAVVVLGWQAPVVHELRTAPGAATEWRLVRVTGTITGLHRTGDRWLAELATPAGTVLFAGLAGAGIPAASLGEGRRATVTGIVRRPYPSASDRRFTLVPRGVADLAVGPAPAPTNAAGGSTPSGDSAGGGGATAGAGGSVGTGAGAAASAAAPDADLRDVGVNVGALVRVGGLVTAMEQDGVRLDDGTGTARLVLEGAASDLLGLLGPGDALTVTGVVEQRSEVVVVVRDPAAVEVAGDLGTGTGAGAGTGTGAAVVAATAGTGSGAMTLPGGAAPSVLGSGRSSGPGPLPLAAGTLVLAGLGGAAAILVHRQRDRRRERSRIRARLDEIGGLDASSGVGPASSGVPHAAADT